MASTIPLGTVPSARAARPATLSALGLVTLVGLFFVVVAALPYYAMDAGQIRSPRRWWLLLHITTGIVALFSGPVQLWLGLTDRRPGLHRRLGMVYLGAIATSSVAAYYLAATNAVGFGFGAGLAGLATAWVITSGLAYLAIRRHLYELHKEWMIRSYVVTFGFVFFRIGATAIGALAPDSRLPGVQAMAWACWALPLLVTEAILQGRKIVAVRV